jgi:hypothetical protein
MTALSRTMLVALLLAASACGGAATPSAAATGAAIECEPLDLQRPDATEIRNRADAVSTVFAGEVLRVRARETVGGGEGRVSDPETGSTPGTPQQPDGAVTAWEHLVSVQAVFRGDTARGKREAVVTEPRAADGVGRLRTGETYLFFVDVEPGMDHFTAAACGAARLRQGLGVRIERVLKAALQEPPAEPEPPQVTLSTPDDGAGEAPALTRLAAPGVALALVGVLGLLLLARANRRRT